MTKALYKTSLCSSRRICTVLSVYAVLTSQSVLAGPMGFDGSTMFMGDMSTNWREAWVNYAITPRDALGVGTLYMRSDDQALTRDLTEVTYTRLLKRWNFPEAQFNIWLPMGIGEITGNDFSGSRVAFTPGLQVDYETRQVYVAGAYRAYRADGINHDFVSLRTGFSLYKTEYEQTQPWLILEARRMHGLSDQLEITPMLRLINKGYFVEFGYSNMHETRFNLMYIF